MKTGDLVKVSNNGFTAIGYIKKVCIGERGKHYIVHYFSQHGKGTSDFSIGGVWSAPYVTILKEVKDEKDTGKT